MKAGSIFIRHNSLYWLDSTLDRIEGFYRSCVLLPSSLVQSTDFKELSKNYF